MLIVQLVMFLNCGPAHQVMLMHVTRCIHLSLCALPHFYGWIEQECVSGIMVCEE